jgi:hypothetical protein
MKSAIATVLLAGLLLNVGAFASDNRAYLRGKAKQTNITVMTKNQAWPAPHPTTLGSCVQGTCSDV